MTSIYRRGIHTCTVRFHLSIFMVSQAGDLSLTCSSYKTEKAVPEPFNPPKAREERSSSETVGKGSQVDTTRAPSEAHEMAQHTQDLRVCRQTDGRAAVEASDCHGIPSPHNNEDAVRLKPSASDSSVCIFPAPTWSKLT